MAEKITVKVYRHKIEKEVYLTRTWGFCGGNEDTEFYKATTNLIEAIQNTAAEVRTGEEFEHWMDSFNGKLYVKYIQKKDMEFDGYSGTLKKEVKLYVRDFEKVILTEG